jgi:hypothetical protein
MRLEQLAHQTIGDEHFREGRKTTESAGNEKRDVGICLKILAELPQTHGQALERFYLDLNSAEKICADLGLSMTDFLSIKDSARESFKQAETGKLVLRLVRLFAIKCNAVRNPR